MCMNIEEIQSQNIYVDKKKHFWLQVGYIWISYKQDKKQGDIFFQILLLSHRNYPQFHNEK